VARELRCTKRDGENGKTERDYGGADLGLQTTQRMAVAARGSGATPPDSCGDGSSTWGSSGYKKIMGSFAKTSSSSSQLHLRRAAVEDGVRRRRLGFGGF
jgi:hypothetical protein